MNIDTWTVYWITRIDDILGFFILVAFLALLPLFIFILLASLRFFDPDPYSYSSEMNKRGLRLVLKWTLPVFILSALVLTFTPTEKDLVKMFVIPRIVNNQSFKDLPAVAEKLIKDYLEEDDK